jgi:hypothetical protein
LQTSKSQGSFQKHLEFELPHLRLYLQMSDLNPTFFKSDLDFCDYAYNDLKIP